MPIRSMERAVNDSEERAPAEERTAEVILLNRMRKVDPNQSKRYRQRTGQ